MKSTSLINHKVPFVVRNSSVHGLGAFTTRRIRKGSRIIEYTGERISAKVADRRYQDDASEHPLVLLFTVNKKTFIDAGVGGNEARYINHACTPNCEAIIESGRIYIHAIRRIEADEELFYDYNLERDSKEDEDSTGAYACHCDASACRGTMLAPLSKAK